MLKQHNRPLSDVVTGTANALAAAIALVTLSASYAIADPIDEAIAGSKVYGDLRLRFEEVDTGSTTEALTLRTVLGVRTGEVNGFSATVEMEDVRDVMGVAETGNTIPDPDDANTELDQAFLQYKNESVTAKLGRQVITLDGHRHVGHVGWRQDKQTFDAGRVTFTPLEGLTVDLSHIYKVNRINSPAFGDVDTDHSLVNVAYTTPIGKFVGYYYGLSEDGLYDETETTGISFGGKVAGEKVTFLYNLEYAMQDNKTSGVEPDYLMLEAGISAAGVTAKVGQETLSSDTEDGVTENFVTPLATVHKFQGWADVFLGGSLFGTIDGGNGVEDLYFSLGGKVAGIKLLAVYHDYESEGGSNDLGEELNLLAVKKFGKRYSVGLKYADYDKGDIGADVEKFWAWIGMKI